MTATPDIELARTLRDLAAGITRSSPPRPSARDVAEALRNAAGRLERGPAAGTVTATPADYAEQVTETMLHLLVMRLPQEQVDQLAEWMHRRHPMLQGDTPLDAIRNGRGAAVHALTKALADGVIF
jgi:hypothetical protein